MSRIVILLWVTFYSNAYAWGIKGHQIVAELAQMDLTAKAHKAVSELLPKQTLVDVCVWADQIRSTSEYRYTAPWHYVDLEDGVSYQQSHHDPAGDVVSALTQQIAILKNRDTSKNEKIEALKFITHFMGDIHQPLHVGRPNDHGGNSIKLTFHKKETNLHALWDNAFIDIQNRKTPQFVNTLKTSVKMNESVSNEVLLTQIVDENMFYRQDIYNFKGSIITDSYAKKATAIVNLRLKLAGKRLATVLNSIFQ